MVPMDYTGASPLKLPRTPAPGPGQTTKIFDSPRAVQRACHCRALVLVLRVTFSELELINDSCKRKSQGIHYLVYPFMYSLVLGCCLA